MFIPLSGILLALHLLVSAGMAVRIIYRMLSVSTTLAWILVIFAAPGIGLLFYFLFGDQRLSRKRLKMGHEIRQHYLDAYHIEDNEIAPEALNLPVHFEHLARVVEKHTGFRPMKGNAVELLSGDQVIFDRMVSDIQNARETCFLEFYIIDPVGRPVDVLNAVLDAASRGVTVKILADDIGSKPFWKSDWPKRLRAAGVEIVSSLSVNVLKSFSKRTDLRNHRKLLLIDQVIGHIGSCNLTDPVHFKPDAGVGRWVDAMIRIQGPFVESLICIFNADFLFDRVGPNVERTDMRGLPDHTIDPDPVGSTTLQVIPSGPEMGESVIYETIVSAIFAAKRSISITTPYFVLDEAIMLALTNAARRGLDVRIVMPTKTDSKLANAASRASFDVLLGAGVEVMLFTGGMLHTKAIVIDECIALFGTVNMDMRSFHLNLEITVAIYNREISSQIEQLIDLYMSEAEPVDADKWYSRPSWQRLGENVIRLIGPLL